MANGGVRFLAAVTVVAAVVAAGGVAGAAPPQPNRAPVQLSPALFHPELAVTLALDTAVAFGVGELKAHGQVCNRGNRDYVMPQDQDAGVVSEYMVYTTHPPRTYAQEANLVFPGVQKIGTTLKVGQCVTHDVTLKIPDFNRWVGPRMIVKPGAGERLAQKQVVFRLNRGFGTIHPNANFPAAEDGDPANNSTYLEVFYMEKTH